MPRICTICSHPERKTIDTALASESASNRRIATQYAVSESAIRRHRAEHLPAQLVKAAEAEDVRAAIDVYTQLKEINAAVRSVLKQAQKDRAGDLVLRASDRILKQLELQARLLDELHDGPVVNVIVSPEWVAVRTTIVAALEAYPEAAQNVAASLTMVEGGN